ncbi:ribonuclease HII [candidate division LCP-89 bacterium B3_LCP]|uniref:Ribonuclease HII n=1 Tax=candidate division LCP-89 bacterium B3_LCP TaxID=2012998 RepID=A0A532UZW0_UNCL8|nr:MAG: ribonuclease HII [candidate division LCP-89 bacterium B3_LCP]
MNKHEKDRIEGLFHFERNLWSAGKHYIAGIDEAGRGPLAGPVVAAAVIFSQELFIPQVNDSKLLSPQQREIIYKSIIAAALDVGIGQASPVEIDSMNILNASLLAMRRAVDDLVIRPDHLLIDGNQMISDCDIPQDSLIKGDSRSFSIAAASIIAKVTRDRIMVDYHHRHPEYGFDKHKGYPVKAHRESIKTHGYCDIHRRSFKVTL